MIRAEKVSKYYGGKRALGPVSFEIEDGETVGFLGLNGAGKTTALRILACDLRPSGGTVAVGDVDALANPHAVRQKIGFLPENPPLYQDMDVTDFLTFAGQLRGMSKGDIARRMPRVLELTHLTEARTELIGHLSHGYRQRVGVAQAIIHDPVLLILDEPTRGLDPVQIVEMRNMIHDLKEKHTVLISSHILTEISQTCDRLLVLGRGALIASGAEQDLTAGMTSVERVTVVVRARGQGSGKADGDAGEGDGEARTGKADPVKDCLAAVDGVTAVSSSKAPYEDARMYRLTCTSDVRAEVSRAVVNAGHDLLELDHGHSELERTFLGLVQGGSDASN